MLNELTHRLDSLKECEERLKSARELIIQKAAEYHEEILMSGSFGGKTEQGTYYVEIRTKSFELLSDIAKIMQYADFNSCDIIESDNFVAKFFYDLW